MHSDESLNDDPRFTLGVISGKIDLVLVQMGADRAATEARFAKAEGRLDTAEDDIASLKRDRAWVVGAAAAVSALGATVAGWLGLTR